MSDRAEVLSRIRAALSDGPPPWDDEVERAYRHSVDASRADIIAEFGQRIVEYRALFRYVEARDLPATVHAACQTRGLHSLVVPHDIPGEWVPDGFEVHRDGPAERLPNELLDRSDGVLTGCALAIAQTGTIILDGGVGQGRRVLTLLPDYHLCVVRAEQVVGLVPEAFARLVPGYGTSRAPLTFISGPSATSDIELSRVEGVHGPRTLEVLLVGSGERIQQEAERLEP